MVNKRSSIFALVLCAVILFPACAATDNDDTSGETVDSIAPSIDGSIYDGTDIASSPFVGKFKNTYSALFASMTKDVFENEDDISYLICESNGDFTFCVNDLASENLITISGTFTVDGDTASFTISGETVPHFTMELINENEMRYLGSELYCVSRGDIFERT